MALINQNSNNENELKVFLSSYPPMIISIVQKLRTLVLEFVPGAIEQIDYPAKLLAFGYKKTYKDTICVIMPYNGWVNLGFPRGASLPDPLQLLCGTGKRARHIKITNLSEIDINAYSELIKGSIEQVQR